MRDYADGDLVVETSSGQVQGFLDRGVPNWRGVPYGRIEQRFRPPVPVAPAGPINARAWGPIGWQLPPIAGMSPSTGFPDAVESENCLNLNIWAPDREPGAKRPVLAWLHFGSRQYGSGSTPLVDAWHFAARHGAVVVTANYRLGAWGWLYLGALDPDFKDSANLTTLDQLLLLRWIRDNAAAFGGDPENVTAFGMSSGSSDLTTLLGAPAAKGLFHKAALYSGAHAPVSAEDAAQFSEEFLAAAGPLASTAADLVTMPNVGLRTIHRRRLRIGTEANEGPYMVRYGPFVDGNVIPQPILDTVETGFTADVPLLVSNTAEEAGLYDCWGAVDNVYARVMPDADPSTDHAEKVSVLSELNWLAPSKRLMTAAHKGGGRVWAQNFDYAPATNWQAALAYPVVASRPVHGADVASLFLDPEGSAGTDTDRAVAAIDQGALLALARDGRAPWEQWSPERPVSERIAPPD
jgi:para-nitrobenzyl esterase